MTACTPIAADVLLQLAAIAVAFVGILALALRPAPKPPAMRTADAAKIEQDTRRVRAGANPPADLRALCSPAPRPGPAVLAFPRAACIQQQARAAARSDHRLHHRHAGNPFARNSREAATWAQAYAQEWEQLQGCGATSTRHAGDGP